MVRLLGMLAVAAAVTGAGRASPLGAVALDEAMTRAADEIKKRLDARPDDQRSVALSSFTCLSDLRATGGAGLAKRLTDELKRRKVPFATRPAVTVVGEYRDVTATDGVTVEKGVLRVTLTDRTGAAVGEPIATTVDDVESLSLLFPGGVQPQRPALTLHPPLTKKTRVMASKASRYEVEVLALDNPTADAPLKKYHPLTPRLEDGLARVEIQRGQAFAVRVYNLSDVDAAVEVLIDGVNMFDFALPELEGKTKIQHLIVSKKEPVRVVRGWYLGRNKFDLFFVTDRDKSAGYSRATMRDLGTITVRFHACWDKVAQRPADEFDFGVRNLGTGTGLLESTADKTQYRKVSVGRVRESVQILYTRP